MPGGRMLSKKISLNKIIASLGSDMSRLLFTWAIAHLDVEGRMHGDPTAFRALVAPRLAHITDDMVGECISEWAEHNLVTAYQANGDTWLQFPKFADNQTGLRKDRESPSSIPAPTPDQLRTNSGPTPDQLPHKRREEKQREEKRAYASNVHLTQTEHDKLEKEHGASLLALAIRKLSDYKETHGRKYKSDAGALRTWALDAAKEKLAKEGNAGAKATVKAKKCPKGHTYYVPPGEKGYCTECDYVEP